MLFAIDSGLMMHQKFNNNIFLDMFNMAYILHITYIYYIFILSVPNSVRIASIYIYWWHSLSLQTVQPLHLFLPPDGAHAHLLLGPTAAAAPIRYVTWLRD